MKLNIHKTLVWNILRATVLEYQGADATFYGYDREIARLGKNLSNALFNKAEKLVLERGGVYAKYKEIAK